MISKAMTNEKIDSQDEGIVSRQLLADVGYFA